MSYGSAEYREKFKDDPAGRLQHHDQPCDECGGSGECEGDPCLYCEGGSVRWGSWYPDDIYTCPRCEDDDEKPVGRMFDCGDQSGERDYACFACYVRVHSEQCGCDLFDWAKGLVVQ